VRLLPDLPGSASDWVMWFFPRDMSNDATVVVGESAKASGNQPVRWSAASGTVALACASEQH